MKKLNVVIMTVIFALCYNTTTYASTTIKSSLEENDDMIQMLNIPSPVDVFTTSFGFFGTFARRWSNSSSWLSATTSSAFSLTAFKFSNSMYISFFVIKNQVLSFLSKIIGYFLLHYLL